MSEIKPVDILLIEDSPGDIRLTKEALKESKVYNNLYVIENGDDALDFLNKRKSYTEVPTPDLIFLDLNLPGKSGQQLLQEIKTDEELKRIPVVVLTTSQDEEDIHNAYGSYANCYITKPIDIDRFIRVVKTIDDFWFSIVKLPKKF